MFQQGGQPASLTVGPESFDGRAVVYRHVNIGDERGYREVLFVTASTVPVVPSDEITIEFKEPASQVRATVFSANIRSDEVGVESVVRLIVIEPEATTAE